MFRELIKFGIDIGDVDIALVACRLYRDALAPGTKKQHKIRVRHLQRFMEKYPSAPLPSDDFSPPSRMFISLVFFAAYLFELPSINAYSTIRNYMSHVRQFYLKKGHPPKKLNSPLLKAVMRGVKRCMRLKQIPGLCSFWFITKYPTSSKTLVLAPRENPSPPFPSVFSPCYAFTPMVSYVLRAWG